MNFELCLDIALITLSVISLLSSIAVGCILDAAHNFKRWLKKQPYYDILDMSIFFWIIFSSINVVLVFPATLACGWDTTLFIYGGAGATTTLIVTIVFVANFTIDKLNKKFDEFKDV